MSLTTAVNNLSNVVALGYPDINADDALQRFKLGQMGFFCDDYGMRNCRYVKNVRGSAFALGDVVRRVADVTVASITSGTKTSITKTGGFTANANIGKVVIYETNNTSAGTAPEGESAIIVANDANKLALDSRYPLSATPNAADAIRIWGPWHADITAGVVLAEDVLGCVIGASGISNGNFGWVQYDGVHPLTAITAAAIAQGVAVVTGAGAVATIGAAAANKVVGYSLATIAATNAGKYPIMWTLSARGAVNL